MSSGISVSDKAKDTINKMKVRMNDDDVNKRMRIVTFTIQNEEINVDQVVRQEECDDAFLKFSEMLTEETCFYVLYDCNYETKEGIKKQEIVFGTWIPDTIGVTLRMKYASSKGAIKNMMKGIKHDFQMNDKADFCNRECFAEHLLKNAPSIQKIEGKPLRN